MFSAVGVSAQPDHAHLAANEWLTDMHLTKLRIVNFRCYQDICIEDIPNLFFLVGDNDVGKTVVLDAIELLLEGKPFSNSDFRTSGSSTATEIKISARFKLDKNDDLAPNHRTGDNDDEFEFSVTGCSSETTTYAVLGKGHSETWIDNLGRTEAQGGIGAIAEKEKLRKLGETDVGNPEKRRSAVERLLNEGKVTLLPKELPVQYKDLAPVLPRIEKTSAESFIHPATLILSGLKIVARETISPSTEGATGPTLDPRLAEVQTEIESSLTAHLRDAEDRLRQLIPGLNSVAIQPNVNFNNVVSGVRIVIDKGEGTRELGELGQGTNRRVWMALQEWQREARRGASERNHIYLFDEPDTALHYGSQQRIYDMLQERASTHGAQCVVSTHSVHLIDRAPTSSIGLIERASTSERTLRRILPSPNDDDVRHFMTDIGRSLGLSNTALLYEKAFLLVEGESEQDALPIYYRTRHGRSMAEDGIHLVNLRSCGAWKPVLEVLFKNRKEYIHLLLDGDCRSPTSSAKLTEERLNDLGGEAFVKNQVTFVGKKEFEDSWPTTAIIRAFDKHYPREDDQDWTHEHIDPFRETDKPSKYLQKRINASAKPSTRGRASKPEIARRVASASTGTEIPEPVVNALDAIRKRAGI